MSDRRGAGSVHFFQGSSNLQFINPQFHTTINSPTIAQENNFEIQRILDDEVAPNAILNAGGRVDIPKCHPGTREEVIAKAERWMTVGYREDRRVFWLSGPAGAGKSAIVQTLAERCIERGAPMANFFFFRFDASRNHSRPVVATLLHQLIEQFPDITPAIREIISRNRLIFKKSLRDQVKLLLDGPIRALRQATPDARPIIILVDGLDECDTRTDLDPVTKAEQTALIQAFHELVTADDSQFIVLVASRIESHIEMAFNRIGCTTGSIYLNDDYQPDNDIRHYVKTELANISLTHPLARYLDVSWPSQSDIDAIVDNSSGQFMYAATVIRFIAGSPQSPAFTMEMVQSIRTINKSSPFAEIDAIYTFILSRSKHWESASEIIALYIMMSIHSRCFFSPSSLGYSAHEIASFFSDLTSIIEAHVGDLGIDLTFHHTSFYDFIDSAERAGRFQIDLTTHANSLAPRLIRTISCLWHFEVVVQVLRKVDERSEALADALTNLPAKPQDVDWESDVFFHVKDQFLHPIKELYANNDPDLYKRIFNHMKQQGWIPADVYLSPTLHLCNLDLQNIQNQMNRELVRRLFQQQAVETASDNSPDFLTMAIRTLMTSALNIDL